MPYWQCSSSHSDKSQEKISSPVSIASNLSPSMAIVVVVVHRESQAKASCCALSKRVRKSSGTEEGVREPKLVEQILEQDNKNPGRGRIFRGWQQFRRLLMMNCR